MIKASYHPAETPFTIRKVWYKYTEDLRPIPIRCEECTAKENLEASGECCLIPCIRDERAGRLRLILVRCTPSGKRVYSDKIKTTKLNNERTRTISKRKKN